MYNLYSYNSTDEFKCSIKESSESESFKSYKIKFDSPFNSGIKENDEVYGEIFISKKKPDTAGSDFSKTARTRKKEQEKHSHDLKGDELIILLHGFASKTGKLENYYIFIDKMLDKGFDCAFLHQPYHLYRTPPGSSSGEKLIYFGDRATLDFYHQAVVDLKRFMDIAVPGLGFKRTILCGFSLGSMVAVIAAATDKRIDKAVLIFGGGNWYQIHWNSTLAHILKGNCIENGKISKEKCRDFYNDFEQFHEEFKKADLNSNISDNLKELPGLKEKTTKYCFLCDPCAFADRIGRNRVLMINSRLDHFFPKSATIQLWKELGRPEIHWFNRLHTSSILANPRAEKIIYDFIKKQQ